MATPIPPLDEIPPRDERRGLRSVRPQAQLGFDETLVEDADLEQLLEERYTAKVDAAAARKDYDDKAEKVTAKIAALAMADDTAVRCGRFRITKKAVAGRSVAFEAKATSRVTITLLDDED